MPAFETHDPRVVDTLNGLRNGLPEYLGLMVEDLGPGRMSCTLEARSDLLNPFGSLHGGVISAMVDHLLGSVCYPVVEIGSWVATTEFKLNLVAPVRGGLVTATAEILAMSKRTGVVQITVENNFAIVAAAQGTVTIMAPRGS